MYYLHYYYTYMYYYILVVVYILVRARTSIYPMCERSYMSQYIYM